MELLPKILEKRMCFSEVKEFLETHKKYRLLSFSELLNVDIEATFIEDNGLIDKNLVNVFYYGKELTANKLTKFPVVVTYSKEYLNALAKVLLALSGTTNINEFREFLPEIIKSKPIYTLGGKSSFKYFKNSLKFEWNEDAKCYI